MKSKHAGCLFALAVIMPADVMAATKNWVGAAGGNWDTPANWSPVNEPIAGDTASFLAM